MFYLSSFLDVTVKELLQLIYTGQTYHMNISAPQRPAANLQHKQHEVNLQSTKCMQL